MGGRYSTVIKQPVIKQPVTPSLTPTIQPIVTSLPGDIEPIVIKHKGVKFVIS